jgi:plasmid stability protein
VTGAYPGVMAMTVHLPDHLAAVLEAEAARRGQSPERVAADLLAERLEPAGKPGRRKLAFAGIGQSSTGRSAAEADEMLAEGFGRDQEC